MQLKVVNWSQHGKQGALRQLLLTENWVHEQHFSSVHIWGELSVVDFGLLGLLVTLDEDLSDADGAAAVSETLLHGLTCESQRLSLYTRLYYFLLVLIKLKGSAFMSV